MISPTYMDDTDAAYEGPMPGKIYFKKPDHAEELEGIPMVFTKHDTDKVMYRGECTYAREAVSEVLTYGSKKYSWDNWRSCKDWDRYEDAATRHEIARKKGEDIDPESGLHHLAHQICSLMFLLEKELNPDIT